MREEKKSVANKALGLGLVISILANGLVIMSAQNLAFLAVGTLLALVGVVLFIWGCWQYATAKGYSGAVGLLGILGLIGLVVLLVLPDRHPEATPGPAYATASLAMGSSGADGPSGLEYSAYATQPVSATAASYGNETFFSTPADLGNGNGDGAGANHLDGHQGQEDDWVEDSPAPNFRSVGSVVPDPSSHWSVKARHVENV